MGHRLRKALETLAGFFTPPACREEVLGDLLERNPTLGRFCIDAIRTIPYVVVGRIRRTAEPQVLLMHALVLYLCYWRAALYEDRSLLTQRWGMLRLAIPGAMVLVCLLVEDAYAKAGHRSRMHLMRGPLLGFAATLLLQITGITLPLGIMLFGGGFALPLTLAIRFLFSPPSASPQGPV